MSPEYQFIRLSKLEGQATLLLCRPSVNVLNIAMMEEMTRALEEVRSDPEVRLLLLRGEGRCFSAGMDVSDHLPDKLDEMLNAMHLLLVSLASLDVVTVSALHGSALGGGLEVAVMTDFTFAVAGTKLGQPEINLGVFPPLAVALYSKLIGVKNACEMILTGRIFSAEEAQQIGLITRAYKSEEFENRLVENCKTLLSMSRAALAATKRAMRRMDPLLFDRLRIAERAYLEDVMSTHDAREGLQAFLEKRAPQWKHQ